ncbi:MAG: MucR family transcriptional regulator [Mailhella sp.]|nr:MucR family transcriptional regulator [Mailhella sp.]
MTDFLKHALELTKAQASVRVMNEDEMMSMVTMLASKLQAMTGVETQLETVADVTPQASDSKKSIKEKSITCLECGKVFKVITKKHLALHNLDANSYRAKWGLKKGTPLTCKELQRARRQKMKDMKLWEKRALARQEKHPMDFGSIEDL